MYSWDKSTRSLKKCTDENQLRLQCPAGDLSGFLKTLIYSQLILRFMVHLCCILVVIWLIKWLVRGSACFSFAWLLAFKIDLLCKSRWIFKKKKKKKKNPISVLQFALFSVIMNLYLLLLRWYKACLLSKSVWCHQEKLASTADWGWFRACQEQHADCSLTVAGFSAVFLSNQNKWTN